MAIFGLMTKKEHARELEALKAAIVQNMPRWMGATAEAEAFSLPDPSVYANQADLYRRLSWVLTAVDLVAQAVSLVGGHVEDTSEKEIDGHEFTQLLSHPNPLDSRIEFLYGSAAMWKLTGNAYWWLNRSNETAKPDELWLIPSHMIQPIPDKNLYLRGYSYDPGNGNKVPLETWEICHFRRFNPFSRYLGLSATESIALISQGDLGMQEWNTKLFKKNNGRLPGILAFEAYPADDIWDDIKKNSMDAAEKRNLMMLRGVGQGGVQWLQNSVSQKDMEFLASRKENRNEIMGVLAPGAASILDVNATEANSKTGRATLMEYGVYPMLATIQEKITSQILPVYGDNQSWSFDDPRVTDRVLELSEIEQYSETHTIEEIRAEWYHDKPIGDERDNMLPIQIAPERILLQTPPENAPVKPLPGSPLQPVSVPDLGGDTQPEPPAELPVKALVELDRWAEKCIKAKKLVTWHNLDIPADVYEAVKSGQATFDQAREMIRPVHKTADDVVAEVRAALEALTNAA
jgi:phage portal protein BeeE